MTLLESLMLGALLSHWLPDNWRHVTQIAAVAAIAVAVHVVVTVLR